MDSGLGYEDARLLTAVPYAADMLDKSEEEVVAVYLDRCQKALDILKAPRRKLTNVECDRLYEAHMLAKKLIDRGVSERKVEEFLNNKYADHEILKYIGEIAASRAAHKDNRNFPTKEFAQKYSCHIK